MQLEIAIYRGLHEKGNTTASFVEHLKFLEQMPFIHALWVNSDKSK